MAAAGNIEKLARWAGREEWRTMLEDVFDTHFAQALDDFGLDFEQLAEMLGDDWSNTMRCCAFEDFLTQPREEDGLTIVDDYLHRRGWKETATGRRYFEALRDSAMSLYEVSDIVPGISFLLRDLIRGGEPVRITERAASRTLKVWDRIAARVVEVPGKTMIAGGVLAFRREAADELARHMENDIKKLRRDLKKAAKEEGRPAPGEEEFEIAAQIYVMQAAPVFSDFWLTDILGVVTGLNRPDLVNSDGDAIEFHTLRFGFKPGAARISVRERLDAVRTFRAEDETFWNWVDAGTGMPAEKGMARASPDKQTQSLQTTLDDGSVVLGTLELFEDALLVEVNSPERAESIEAILMGAAKDLLSPPSSRARSVDEFLDQEPDESAGSPSLELTPEIEARILREAFDAHYRKLLDEPIPAFGGKTPRALARSAAGKRKVAEWLKGAENAAAQLEIGDTAVKYDFGWMWQELGISGLRR